MESSSTETTLPMNTILHLITIRLSPSNYLLWVNQMTPLLTYQNLFDHIDGSSQAPPSHLVVDGKPTLNPAHAEWLAADQRAVILLQASLTEEAFSEIVGLTTARSIWLALEASFGNSSMERVHNLRDTLRLLTKGSASVSDFGRRFKTICDQLAAIGHPVDDEDKNHHFLRGLGGSFEAFSTDIRASGMPHSFRDLLAKAEGHDMFISLLHGGSTPPVAFSAAAAPSASAAATASRGRGRGGRGGGRGGRGRGRRPPHCQLCRNNGHYASQCPQLPSFASSPPANDSDLVKAFLAKCNVSTSGPDWYVDSGASDHMVSSSASVNQPVPFGGDGSVLFGNGNTPVSYTHLRAHET